MEPYKSKTKSIRLLLGILVFSVSMGVLSYTLTSVLLLLGILIAKLVMVLANLYGTYGLFLTGVPLVVGSVVFLALILYLLLV